MVDFISGVIGQLGRPTVSANQFDQLGRIGAQVIDQNQQKGQNQEAQYIGAMLNATPEQRQMILAQGTEAGVFDEDDSDLASNFDQYAPEMVSFLQVNGYEKLLPEAYRNNGASKYGRVQAGIGADDEAVFFQADGQGNLKTVDGVKPITTTDKENAKTQALIDRENKLKSQQNKLNAQEMEIAKSRLDLDLTQRKTSIQDQEATYGIELANDLLTSDLDIIYGWGESFYPDRLRSQDGIDISTKRNQLISILQLGARGKLKGQGPITEGEQKILSRAVTSLSNPDISVELAKSEVSAAIDSLKRTMSDEAASSLPDANSQTMSDQDILNKYLQQD